MSTGLAVFTLFHVALSVVGILAGFFVVFGLISAKQSKIWTGTFLVTTVATSVTGFLFPLHKFLPSHALGIVSIFVLALTIPVSERLRINCSVFPEDSGTQGAGTTQSEPPFLGTQIVVMLIFIVLGVLATRRFPGRPVHVS